MANTRETTKGDVRNESGSGKHSDTASETSTVQEEIGTLTSETAAQVRDAATGVKEQVRQQALGQVTTQKERAADGLEMVVGLLRQASQQVSEQDHAPVAVSIDGVADRIDAWSETLRTQDLTDLLDEAKELARRQPALFVSGALAAGFLTVRFFKSSSSSTSALTTAPSAGNRSSSERDGKRSSGGDEATTVLTDLEDLETLLPSSSAEQANEATR